ncbi:hypothetical protein [Nonomuraea sp. KM88]|uniref:hypothetical protein n=1 Tax=Nonomuraea sp. KM88 TaxID=3457427 RepID=UPI003FCE3B8A
MPVRYVSDFAVKARQGQRFADDRDRLRKQADQALRAQAQNETAAVAALMRSDVRPATRLLLEQVEAIAGLWRAAHTDRRDDWRYASLAEMLLAHGRLFTPASRPAAFVPGPSGTCFATACRLTDEHAGLLSVEGMVITEDLPFAFDHAWCSTAASDHVIDPTLPDGIGLGYLGIALTDGYRRAQPPPSLTPRSKRSGPST